MRMYDKNICTDSFSHTRAHPIFYASRSDSFSHTRAHPIFYANRSDSFSDTAANNCRQLSLSGTNRNAYTSSDATTYSSSHTKPYT